MTTITTIRDLWHAARVAASSHAVVRAYPAGTTHRVERLTAPSRIPTVRLPRGSALMPLRGQVVAAVAARNAALTVQPSTLKQRLQVHLVEVYTDVIAARGGETRIETERGAEHLLVADHVGGLTLLRAEGWRYYSRGYGSRHATLAYICGRDDNGRWAVRVPGTCRTVADALDFVEPGAVKTARTVGKRVLRQGDVYAIETARAHDQSGDPLPSNHHWDAHTRTLRHADPDAPHGALHVPFPCRWAVQSTLRMGRRNGRRRGD